MVLLFDFITCKVLFGDLVQRNSQQNDRGTGLNKVYLKPGEKLETIFIEFCFKKGDLIFSVPYCSHPPTALNLKLCFSTFPSFLNWRFSWSFYHIIFKHVLINLDDIKIKFCNFLFTEVSHFRGS